MIDFIGIGDFYVYYSYSISTEKRIASRTVQDSVTMFGDIGGISSFLMTALGLLVGALPTKLFEIEKSKTLFMTNNRKQRSHQRNSDDRWFKETRPILFSFL